MAIWLNAISKRLGDDARSSPLTRETLAKLRLRALRRGLWFSGLKQSERKLLELTISVVQRVRSFMLAKIVSKIVSKLCEALESRVFRLIRTEGRCMVEKLSKIAQNWGYENARNWVEDQGFRQYLVVCNLNVLGG